MISREVAESIHLDYKASPALLGKVGEIAKDVSAFANSDGGVIIYGVEEYEHKPVKIDCGVPHKRYTREWLEDLIQGNITPRIEQLTILQLPVSPTHSMYVVGVQKSERAPHQERTGLRYYKRHNFKSSPMEDYEIQDIRNRVVSSAPSVVVDVEIEQGSMFNLYVENVGNEAALDLCFVFSKDLVWLHDAPKAFSSGMRVLSKGRKLSFLYASAVEALATGSKVVTDFSVDISYLNPRTGKRIADQFAIDLTSFMHSLVSHSDLYRHGEKLEASLNKLVREAQRVVDGLEPLRALVGPTGLRLSVTTWRTFARLLGKSIDLPPINPRGCSYKVFEEVLLIDTDLAMRIERFFLHDERNASLDDIPGFEGEIKERFERHFKR